MNAPPPVRGCQRRRVAARPWGEEALSPRGRASHSVDGRIHSVRDDVILAHSSALLLSGLAAACTNQSQAPDERCFAFAWAHRDGTGLRALSSLPARVVGNDVRRRDGPFAKTRRQGGKRFHASYDKIVQIRPWMDFRRNWSTSSANGHS
jgi:hypothetical protein